MNLIEVYNIVPIGDNCHFLCENPNTGHYEMHYKGFRKPKHLKELIFKTWGEANQFISDNNFVDCYEPQMFWINGDMVKLED